jgi:hypothetical protein
LQIQRHSRNRAHGLWGHRRHNAQFIRATSKQCFDYFSYSLELIKITEKSQIAVLDTDYDCGSARFHSLALASALPARGVVFTGDWNRDVPVLEATNGSVLWRNVAGAALGGGVIAYRTDANAWLLPPG